MFLHKAETFLRVYVCVCVLMCREEHTHVYALCIGSNLRKEKKSLVEPWNSRQMLPGNVDFSL